jgi:DNA-binding beta-propeller fold protein YncE
MKVSKPIFTVASSYLICALAYAAPLSIIPKVGTTLPTTVILDVEALYTITNTTGSFHANNYVKYLPPNVTQITTDPSFPDLCQSTFSLNAGQSCTLELNITGAVNANDPNPQHHLFACLGGCKTCCAGTNFPLNVTKTTQAYIANSGGNTISLCLVNTSTGALSDCIAMSDPTFNGPWGVSLNPSGTFAYVPNFLNDTVSICPVDPTTGQLQACVASGANGTLHKPQVARVNPSATYLYIGNNLPTDNFGTIAICPLMDGGATIGTCIPNTGDGLFASPQDILFSVDGSIVYVANLPNVAVCSVTNGGASFNGCTLSSGSGTFDATFGINANFSRTTLYVANANNNTVSICSLAGNSITNCSTTTGNGTFNFVSGLDPQGVEAQLWMQAPFNVGYIPNAGSNSLSICPINTDGSLGTCVLFNDPTFNLPSSITIR